MLLTVFGVAFFAVVQIASLVLQAGFLWLGLRWAKAPRVTVGGIAWAIALMMVLETGNLIRSLLVSPGSRAAMVAVLAPCALVALQWLVIARIFKLRFLRAVQAWLPTLVPGVAMAALALGVIRPYLYEAFVIPANSMAPTVLGNHWQGVCPTCGRPCYCSPQEEQFGDPSPPAMICERFHVAPGAKIDRHVLPGDRLLVAKFLAPRRWDLVVFRLPTEPSVMFMKRLVGLPGERVRIAEGAVWINGVKQIPPDAIRDIQYLSELPGSPVPLWGSDQRPVVLGEDEYFVLGDFSAQSKDSRLWEQGAAGHAPFAVPQSHLCGVVTHIYWPPSRGRILR